MKILLSSFILLFVLTSYGQDIHWSQYFYNPNYLNPGNVGKFDGDFRFHANYRNQWRSVTVPFKTLQLSADTRWKKDSTLGIGVSLFNDAAGDGTFRTLEAFVQINKVIQPFPNKNHTFRPGITFGFNYRTIDWSKLYFDNQFNGVNFDPSLSTNEQYSVDSKFNLNTGIGGVYTYKQSDKLTFDAGIGSFNLNRPNQGFYQLKIPRAIRTTFYAQATYQLTNGIILLPTLSFSSQGTYKELVIGATGKLKMETIQIPTHLLGGFYFRNKDAFYLHTGMEYGNWMGSISYDINISKLIPASNLRGGVEVAIRYIIRRYKPSKMLHRICPDYI